jgi:hypothetical protein
MNVWGMLCRLCKEYIIGASTRKYPHDIEMKNMGSCSNDLDEGLSSGLVGSSV